MTDPVLQVEDLVVHFPVKMGVVQGAGRRILRVLGVAGREDGDEFIRPRVHAVDGISFTLQRGEVFGLVGESGCGKTTTGRSVIRLQKPTGGRIAFEGVDITSMKEKELRPLRPRMQIVFQDPHAALNPAMTIGQAIQDPLLIHGAAPEEARQATLKVMDEVGLAPAEDLYNKYPADLSGGQKQRAVIARAIIHRPSLIIADEPVAMLDMSIRARILELLLDLKRKYGLTYLFITHDLATAKFVCDRIAIMYLGRIVEMGPASSIYADPKHPYTKALIAAIPVPEPGRTREVSLPRGEVPDAITPPRGCRFHPRCPVALATCGWEGRDFIDLVERQRLDLGQATGEVAVLGAPEQWEADRFAAGRVIGDEGADRLVGAVKALLVRAPGALAQAVTSVAADERDVVVKFRPPDPLGPKDVGDRTIECLLY